jgi:LacI family transcriptional regulator
MVTQEQIAKDLGLSVMTVYRCLSKNGSASPKTRKKVGDYIEKYNYRPNLMARSLKLKKSNIIGLLVPSFTYSFYPEIIESIQETLKKCGYNLLLCLSNESPESEREELEMLMTIPVDGILMSPVNSDKAIKNCQLLQKREIPFVLFDRYFQEMEINCSYVATDSFSASKQLVDYLADCGHKIIAHIGGSMDNSFSRLMFEGYKAGLKANGLSFCKELVFRGSLEEATGIAGIKKLCESKLKFTAVHTANDPIAIGVLNACIELGIKIPEQLSVTGFSDISLAEKLYVPLTTVKEPTAEIGRIAAEELIKQIESDEKIAPVKKLLTGTFIMRKSCAGI